MNRKGNRAESRRHPGEKNHAETLETLLADDAAEYRQDFPEVLPVGNEAAALGKVIVVVHDINRIQQSEHSSDHCADGGAHDAQFGERTHTEDQQAVYDDVHDIAGHVRAHDRARFPEAKLDSLQYRSHGSDIDREDGYAAVHQRLRKVIASGAHQQ